MGLTLVCFAVSIWLVVKGGDRFVDAASWMAEASGIPRLIVGATVVSVATTLPELLVSLLAAAQGKVDMAIGNAVGSVTANIGLIMALAMLFMPGPIRRRDYLPKAALMLLAMGIIAGCGFSGRVSLVPSLVLLAVFAAFIRENLTGARRMMAERPDRRRRSVGRRELLGHMASFLLGGAAILIGARLLVDSAATLARAAGVSERVIGVTLVAVGTSLPELVTTVSSIAKGRSDLSVGNILGANILDLTMILPLSALVSGRALPVSAAAAVVDLPVCLLVGAVAVIPAVARERLERWQGAVLLFLYGAYLVITCAMGV